MGKVTTIVQAGSADQPARIEVPTSPAAPAEPAVVVGDNPAPGVITIQRGGKTITIDGATGTTIGGSRNGGGGGTTSGTEFPFPSDIPPGVQSIATTAIVGFCMMVAAFPVFGYLKALVNRNALRQNALPSRDTTDRLQRIEAAVEAMSVEVERISEGQRFVTRVLSERSSAQN